MPIYSSISNSGGGSGSGGATEITQEEMRQTLETLGYFLSSILEKLPRLDVNDRVAANVETGSLASVSTVATVTNMTNLNNFGGGNTALMPYWMSSPGIQHAYNQLEFV